MITYKFPAGGRLAKERLSGQIVTGGDGNEWVEVRVASEGDFGPGTELAAMLAGFPLYIKSSAGCHCKRRASIMNANERAMPGWCEGNVSTIVGWLQEEHARQKIMVPFVPLVAEQLVRLAIRRARKKGTQR